MSILIVALILALVAAYIAIRCAMHIARRFYAWRAIAIGMFLVVVAGLIHAIVGFENPLALLTEGKPFSPMAAIIYWVHAVVLIAGWSVAPSVGWLFGRRRKGANHSLKADGADAPRL